VDETSRKRVRSYSATSRWLKRVIESIGYIGMHQQGRNLNSTDHSGTIVSNVLQELSSVEIRHENRLTSNASDVLKKPRLDFVIETESWNVVIFLYL